MAEHLKWEYKGQGVITSLSSSTRYTSIIAYKALLSDVLKYPVRYSMHLNWKYCFKHKEFVLVGATNSLRTLLSSEGLFPSQYLKHQALIKF